MHYNFVIVFPSVLRYTVRRSIGQYDTSQTCLSLDALLIRPIATSASPITGPFPRYLTSVGLENCTALFIIIHRNESIERQLTSLENDFAAAFERSTIGHSCH